MAIETLARITIVGLERDQSQILADLQTLGVVHLVSLNPSGEGITPDHGHPNLLRQALHFLKASPELRPPTGESLECETLALAEETLTIAQRLRKGYERREQLAADIESLKPWGHFVVPPDDALAGNKLWFYRIPHHLSPAHDDVSAALVRISADREAEYWVAVASSRPAGLPVPPLELPQASLQQLQLQLSEMEADIERLEGRRAALTRYRDLLAGEIDLADDFVERQMAMDKVFRDKSLFAIQGWIPERLVPLLQRFAGERQLALRIDPITAADKPPTLLRNRAWVGGAEDAVRFYITPEYRSWDPTWMMYVFFSLFFAMIMADAGYGLILLAIVGFLFSKYRDSAPHRRLISLGLAMSIVAIIYGVIVGSYFGFTPGSDSLLGRLMWKVESRSIMENREAMMLLTASIGVLHLVVANIVTTWQRWGKSQALSSLGWGIGLLSGLLLAIAKLPRPDLGSWAAARIGWEPGQVDDLLTSVGTVGLVAGLTGVFLFSSDRPFFSRSVRDWAWRPVEGLLSLTNVSKAFGDTLSYLRLFALGLASAQLAITFNDLASKATHVRGIGLFLGIMIFVVGHGLNFVLGVVGGVVHGLRLNCIEFFGWSLTDEGYPFVAFQKKAKER